jgi:hypothetical protein
MHAMARKPILSLEHLASLDAEKLAALVLEEAAGNAGFKRRINAALAGQSGPEAIAKLIDRRLAGLERARSFIDWDKILLFRDDLKGLLGSVLGELGPADPALAADRLLRFIATHGPVFERIDDSSGHVQDVAARLSRGWVLSPGRCLSRIVIRCPILSWRDWGIPKTAI